MRRAAHTPLLLAVLALAGGCAVPSALQGEPDAPAMAVSETADCDCRLTRAKRDARIKNDAERTP